MAFVRWLGQMLLVCVAMGAVAVVLAVVVEGAHAAAGAIGVVALVLLVGWWARDNR